jgi:hypothetical protein
VARVTVIAGPTRSSAISKRKPPKERGGVPQAHAVSEQNIHAVKETVLSHQRRFRAARGLEGALP